MGPPSASTPSVAPKERESRQARAAAVRALRAKGIRDARVLAAIAETPREQFVPGYHTLAEIYGDLPLPIGHGQTISSLYMQALMMEAAELSPGDRVLDVGTGSGYQSAVLGRMGVEVWSVEAVPDLSDIARETLRSLHCDNVHVLLGNGCKGCPPDCYDAILVCATAPEIPRALVRCLKQRGRLVVPVGSRTDQRLFKVTREAQGIHVESLGECRFLSTLRP